MYVLWKKITWCRTKISTARVWKGWKIPILGAPPTIRPWKRVGWGFWGRPKASKRWSNFFKKVDKFPQDYWMWQTHRVSGKYFGLEDGEKFNSKVALFSRDPNEEIAHIIPTRLHDGTNLVPCNHTKNIFFVDFEPCASRCDSTLVDQQTMHVQSSKNVLCWCSESGGAGGG